MSGDEWVTSATEKTPIQIFPCNLFDDSDKMVTSGFENHHPNFSSSNALTRVPSWVPFFYNQTHKLCQDSTHQQHKKRSKI